MRSLLLLLGLLLLKPCSAFTITLGSNEQICFHESLNKGERYGVNFQVAQGGSLDVDFKMTGPFGEDIHSVEKEGIGSFVFTVENAGRHEYCFTNGKSSIAAKRITFGEIGAAAFGSLQPKEKKEVNSMTPLDNEINTLNYGLWSIKNDQQYFVIRERQHRNTGESTNARVLWWSLFQITMLIAVCLWQVYYLKRFFEVKRVL